MILPDQKPVRANRRFDFDIAIHFPPSFRSYAVNLNGATARINVGYPKRGLLAGGVGQAGVGRNDQYLPLCIVGGLTQGHSGKIHTVHGRVDELV